MTGATSTLGVGRDSDQVGGGDRGTREAGGPRGRVQDLTSRFQEDVSVLVDPRTDSSGRPSD